MPTASDKRALRERVLKAPEAVTPEEERQIDAGIAADPDSPELDVDFFSQAKRGRGRRAYSAAAVSRTRSMRAPQAESFSSRRS